MAIPTMVPAVVLSSQAIGLVVIRALGRMGVPVTAVQYKSNQMGVVSKYVKKRIRAPHPEGDEQGFLCVLLENADPLCRAVLIPTDDATLSVVSRHKRLLESYYIVASADESITEKFINKKHTYEIAERIGVPAPKTVVPHSVEDVERYSAAVEFPCLIKPCHGHRYFELFGKKMAKVDTIDEMIVEYEKASESGNEVMIQELIPGNDTAGANYNSFFWNNEPFVEFTAEKVRLSPPAFGFPRVVVSKDIPEIIEPGRRILRAMGFYGYSCIEFKRDARDGVYKLMEVNGRHNRSGLLALHCGINFPWIEYQHHLGGSLQHPPHAQEGVYWIDDFKDLLHNIRFAKEERYTLSEYVRPYLQPHIFATYSVDDPMPFLKRCIDLGKRAFAELLCRPIARLVQGASSRWLRRISPRAAATSTPPPTMATGVGLKPHARLRLDK